MKNIIYQFYNEGFATLFCLKPINYIKDNVKSKRIVAIMSIIIKILYTIAIIGLVTILIYFKYC